MELWFLFSAHCLIMLVIWQYCSGVKVTWRKQIEKLLRRIAPLKYQEDDDGLVSFT